MLITLEGIDGSGKSSVCEILQEKYPSAVFTREPTNSWYGEAVRRSISSPDADPLAELFLYTADHADHLSRVVLPALADGKLVISDRYSDSRYAYQGATLSSKLDTPIEFIKQVHAPWTRPPEYTFYLDVPPELGAERSGSNNKFEQANYLRAVAENYEQLIRMDPDRYIRVDSTKGLETVAATVIDHIDRLLKA